MSRGVTEKAYVVMRDTPAVFSKGSATFVAAPVFPSPDSRGVTEKAYVVMRDTPAVFSKGSATFVAFFEGQLWFCTISPFLIGRMFVREPSWKYSANLVGS